METRVIEIKKIWHNEKTDVIEDMDGEKYSTFDKEFLEGYEDGQEVKIAYEQKGQYKNLVKITKDMDEEFVLDDIKPKETSKDVDEAGNMITRPAENMERTNNRNGRKINKDFIVKIQGNEFITANGLLAIAEEEGGIEKMEIIDVKYDYENKFAMASVRIVMKDGRVFENVGTGSKENVSSHMLKNFVEMAVTRAQSRALRMGLNVDYCTQEEVH